jgi:hypothetical protein
MLRRKRLPLTEFCKSNELGIEISRPGRRGSKQRDPRLRLGLRFNCNRQRSIHSRLLVYGLYGFNDANNGGDDSSDAGDANTSGNNMRNQDSSRRNTAHSRLEHQIQKLHALQPWLDSAPRQPDPARRDVVTDTFSYFSTSTGLKAPLVPRVFCPGPCRFIDRRRDCKSRNLQCRHDDLQDAYFQKKQSGTLRLPLPKSRKS